MHQTTRTALAAAAALAVGALRAAGAGTQLPAALTAGAGTLIAGAAVLFVLAVAGGGWRPRT